MNRHSITFVATLGLIASSALSSTSALASQSPDARDANIAAIAVRPAPSVSRDVRSPDARDAAARAVAPASQVSSIADGRSPDTRDVANGVKFVTVPSSPVGVVSHTDSSFRWGDAGLGAALVLALLALIGGATMQYRRRHHHGAPVAG
jgi:hypothetical protein